MRRSRVQLLVAAPSVGNEVSDSNVSACIYRDNVLSVVDTEQARGQNRASLHGGVPERSKGSDCKSDGLAFVGSNPTPSTRQSRRSSDRHHSAHRLVAAIAARSHLIEVERIMRRVWFNGRTSAFQAEGAGSIPATRSIERSPPGVMGGLTSVEPYIRKVNSSHSSVGRALPW